MDPECEKCEEEYCDEEVCPKHPEEEIKSGIIELGPFMITRNKYGWGIIRSFWHGRYSWRHGAIYTPFGKIVW